MMSDAHREFEKTVRRRVLIGALNHATAMSAGFIDVMQLQSYAAGAQHLADSSQVLSLARRFGIPIPPGYGAAPRAA
jgi:hypothetical protein